MRHKIDETTGFAMRVILFLFFSLILWSQASEAQSVSDNLPQGTSGYAPAEPTTPPAPVTTPNAESYTITDVNADVTADTAAHARDQALMQAERSAFTQLCQRLNLSDSAPKLDDDTIAGLVSSFEVQSERLSAVRYIGVFTIRFKPTAFQKRIGKYVGPTSDPLNPAAVVAEDVKAAAGPTSHLLIAVQTDSLATWTQIKKRLMASAQVARVDVIDLARGQSHIDLAYTGAIPDLQSALTTQGLVLRQAPQGGWTLYDGSMVAR